MLYEKLSTMLKMSRTQLFVHSKHQKFNVLSVITLLFTGFLAPGKSVGTFHSLNQIATSSPNYYRWWRLHTVIFIAKRQPGNTGHANFYRFWFDPTGNGIWVHHFSRRRSIHLTTDRRNDLIPRRSRAQKLSPNSVCNRLKLPQFAHRSLN